MNDKDFIKNFSKITLTGICKKLKVNRGNVIAGTTKKQNLKKVREEIESEVAKLYIKEEK